MTASGRRSVLVSRDAQHFVDVQAPRFREYRRARHEVLEKHKIRLRLSEFEPRILSSFVRNQLIDKVYLPIVGDNLALQGLKENQRCARRSGILEASDGAYKNISSEAAEVEVKGSKLLDRVQVRILDPVRQLESEVICLDNRRPSVGPL